MTIDSPGSLPGQTLEPIYNSGLVDFTWKTFTPCDTFLNISFNIFFSFIIKNENLGKEEDENRLLLMYNDEFPNGTSSATAAHAKGVVAFDGQSGFWLVHSVPRFPPAPDGGPPGTKGNYSYPTTGLRYGQTMLCVSLPLHQADLIGEWRDQWVHILLWNCYGSCFTLHYGPQKYQTHERECLVEHVRAPVKWVSLPFPRGSKFLATCMIFASHRYRCSNLDKAIIFPFNFGQNSFIGGKKKFLHCYELMITRKLQKETCKQGLFPKQEYIIIWKRRTTRGWIEITNR